MSDSLIPDPRHWLEVVPAALKASPLYSELWRHLKGDLELLALLHLVDADQPIPITFFTTVNYLVLRELVVPWAVFYPYLNPDATPPISEAYGVFRAFVLEHRKALQDLLPTAQLQTNEVTRCANLLPAFTLVYLRGGCEPLHMIEIGSSIGLNLLWNQYQYTYVHSTNDADTSKNVYVGKNTAPVQLQCTSEAIAVPHGLLMVPPVAHIQGIERSPRSIHSTEDVLWVQAAIWPEEVHRYRLLDQALSFVRLHDPLPLLAGDACEHLPRLLEDVPEDRTAVVWHSYALNQGPHEGKNHIIQQIAAASKRCTIYRVSLEFTPGQDPGPYLDLYEYRGGRVIRLDRLAGATVHGERMTWLYNGELF